jgi:hypothetical protein
LKFELTFIFPTHNITVAPSHYSDGNGNLADCIGSLRAGIIANAKDNNGLYVLGDKIINLNNVVYIHISESKEWHQNKLRKYWRSASVEYE